MDKPFLVRQSDTKYINDEVLNFLKCLKWLQMTSERAQKMKKNEFENLILWGRNSFEK